LDIELDVDLIEEVGRMYGYHNIEPQPIKLQVPYRPNIVNNNADKLRNTLVGFGFIECLNYGFIPSDSMKILGLNKGDIYYGDIIIQNPLSNFYSLMRPTLAYSLISTAVNNLKKGSTDIKIFEIGKVFFRDKNYEDGYNEKEVVGGLLCGVKFKKGFGQNKEIKYSVFDITGLVKSLLCDFGVNYSFLNSDKINFLETGAGAEIFVENKKIGCVGAISEKTLKFFESNVIKDEMFYFEFDFANLNEQRREILYESNFPAITREYNFLVKNGIHFDEYKDIILKSSDLVIEVKPIDVYQGQGVPNGMSSVLISVSFNSPKRTLESSEIDLIDNDFKEKLKQKYQIELKL